MLQFWLAVLLIFLTVVHTSDTDQVKRMVQSTAVRGKFICGQKPAIGVRIKLFEHDFNPTNGYNQPVPPSEYMLGKLA